MCGIVGYVGSQRASTLLLEGLKKLEYRGYDSAGIAVLNRGEVQVVRAEGKLAELVSLLDRKPMEGNVGIGHTRWATHGVPSERNAHPHRVGDVALVHNGIIENYNQLREELKTEGAVFQSETDTEIFCHLIYKAWQKNSNGMEAIRAALARVRGTYALVVLNQKETSKLYVARSGSPLVVGFGKGENFVASDVPALLPYTRDVAFLDDDEIGILEANSLKIFDKSGLEVSKKKETISWDTQMAEKGGYKHFMLKEIFEQPNVVEDSISGRLNPHTGEVMLDEVSKFISNKKLAFQKLSIIACGTSYHAALIAKYWFESMTKLHTNVDLASEFRYRSPLVDKDTLVIGVSQSGETADTLAALRLAKEMGATTLAVTNVLGSTISRESDEVVYTHAGPEIGVASTKAFTSQLTVLFLLSLFFQQQQGFAKKEESMNFVEELRHIPHHIQTLLDKHLHIKKLSTHFSNASHFLFIGRGVHYPVALEGALKLKEISYLHAEGFAAGELKHGPIALIEKGVPVLALIPENGIYEKLLSNIAEVKARGATVIGIGSEKNEKSLLNIDSYITIPKVHYWVSPILYAVPLQLFAYYIANHRGTDVDQPRNLAKSVTVE